MGFLIDIGRNEKALRNAITELYQKDRQGFTNLASMVEEIEKKPPFIPEEAIGKYFIFTDEDGNEWYQHLFYSEENNRICIYGYCGEKAMCEYFNQEMFNDLIRDYKEISAEKFYDNLYDVMRKKFQ